MKILSILVLIVFTAALEPVLSQVHPHGAPVNIMQFTTNQSVSVDYDAIETMFLHPEVKDRKIVVISIIGAFRKGKSFFMDYCLRYMYAHYKSVNFPNNPLASQSDWIGAPDAPLLGFSWKAGPHRDTSGIIVWSDVFLHQNLAIVLMDTQGLFDAKTSPADNSRIFALGTLVSSLQIFNLNDVIQENQLEYLQMATDYAKFVANNSESSTSKPFQNLMFLMRDWSSSQIFPFGMTGGSLYLADVLEIKDYQSPELQGVRNYIKSSFENVNCFLMPHPGLQVVNDNSYDGRFSTLGARFQDNLKQLLESMLDPANLKIKTILGSEVTGHDFNGYCKSYFQKFQSPDTPKIPSIYEATIEMQFLNFLDTALNAYKKALKKYQPDYDTPNFNLVLEALYKNCSEMVTLGFDQQKKMGTLEHEKRYRGLLQKDMLSYYDQWKQGLLDTHKTIQQLEAKNKKDKDQLLKDSQAKFATATGQLEAEKQDLLAQGKQREIDIKANDQLREEEKQAALQKLHDEMKQQNIEFEKERQQIIAQQKAENAKILADNESRRLKDEANVKLLIATHDKANADFQMQLQKERDDRLAQIKHDAMEREKDRKLQQEQRDKEDALRREELKLLAGRIDAESKDRIRMLELQEKQRKEEREERLAQQALDNQRYERDRIDRQREMEQQRQQFEARMASLSRNAGTITSPNLFSITFAFGVFSVLMFRK